MTGFSALRCSKAPHNRRLCVIKPHEFCKLGAAWDSVRYLRRMCAVTRAGRSGAEGDLGEVPCSSALPPARRPLGRDPSDRLREVRRYVVLHSSTARSRMTATPASEAAN